MEAGRCQGPPLPPGGDGTSWHRESGAPRGGPGSRAKVSRACPQAQCSPATSWEWGGPSPGLRTRGPGLESRLSLWQWGRDPGESPARDSDSSSGHSFREGCVGRRRVRPPHHLVHPDRTGRRAPRPPVLPGVRTHRLQVVPRAGGEVAGHLHLPGLEHRGDEQSLSPQELAVHGPGAGVLGEPSHVGGEACGPGDLRSGRPGGPQGRGAGPRARTVPPLLVRWLPVRALPAAAALTRQGA